MRMWKVKVKGMVKKSSPGERNECYRYWWDSKRSKVTLGCVYLKVKQGRWKSLEKKWEGKFFWVCLNGLQGLQNNFNCTENKNQSSDFLSITYELLESTNQNGLTNGNLNSAARLSFFLVEIPCNSSNISHWFNPMVVKGCHVIDPCLT